MTENIIGAAFEGIESAVRTALGRPMEICIVSSSGMGGSGIMGSSIASSLSERGHGVHLVSYRRPFRLSNKKVSTHFIPLRNYQALEHFPVVMSAASKIYDVAKRHDIDIINVHYAIPYSTASYLAREMFKSDGAKLPVVTTVHGTDVHTIGQRKELKDVVRFTLKSSDGITSVCKYLAGQIKEKFDIDNGTKVIYNYVDAERFRKIENPSMRRKLGGNGKKILLHASNFRAVKNIDHIIDVFRKVSKDVPARLVLVGDGPERQRIRKKVARLNLKDVLFLGPREDMEKFYSASDIFLMASAKEGCPLSILEAMSSQLPVISTGVGGIPEIVSDGRAGLLAEVGDIDAMADKAVGVLTSDRKREKMGDAARSRVLKNFTAEKIIPQYERYYRKLLIR